jgi:DNA-binding GntR family transcriptional regulator
MDANWSNHLIIQSLWGSFPLMLLLMWDMLANLMRKSQNKIYRISWTPKKALHAHKKIYLALKAKDPGRAVEAMKQHMLDEEKALLAALEKGKD